MTTALLNGTPAEFIPANLSPDATGPVVVTVSAPLQLTLADVIGVLYDLGTDYTAADLDDDTTARHLIAEIVINCGLLEVDSLACQASEIRPGHPNHDWLTYVQRRAAELFPTLPGAANLLGSRPATPDITARPLTVVGGAR